MEIVAVFVLFGLVLTIIYVVCVSLGFSSRPSPQPIPRRSVNMNISGTSVININGRTIEVRNGNVYVNGRLYLPADGDAPAPTTNRIELSQDGQITGDVNGDLEVRGNNVTLIVRGNVEGSVTCDGELQCGPIGGSATAGGSIQAHRVGGSGNAGRDITVNQIGGSANAGRDIRRV